MNGQYERLPNQKKGFLCSFLHTSGQNDQLKLVKIKISLRLLFSMRLEIIYLFPYKISAYVIPTEVEENQLLYSYCQMLELGYYHTSTTRLKHQETVIK